MKLSEFKSRSAYVKACLEYCDARDKEVYNQVPREDLWPKTAPSQGIKTFDRVKWLTARGLGFEA